MGGCRPAGRRRGNGGRGSNRTILANLVGSTRAALSRVAGRRCAFSARYLRASRTAASERPPSLRPLSCGRRRPRAALAGCWRSIITRRIGTGVTMSGGTGVAMRGGGDVVIQGGGGETGVTMGGGGGVIQSGGGNVIIGCGGGVIHGDGGGVVIHSGGGGDVKFGGRGVTFCGEFAAGRRYRVGRWSAFWVGGPAFVGRRSSFVGRRSVFGSGAAFSVGISAAELHFGLVFGS